MAKKSKNKSGKIPAGIDISTHKTERSAAAVLMVWMREILKEKNIELGMPDVDTGGADGKFPDIIIYDAPGSNQAVCVIEAKPPSFDVFNEEELKEPARIKATQRKAKYFALTNFRRLIWFNTEKVNQMSMEEEQIIGKYLLSNIDDINDIEFARHSETIKRTLEEFLTKLWLVYTGREAEPKLPIDELLTFRLYEKIQFLAGHYRVVIERQCKEDKTFRANVRRWFIEQQWDFTGQPKDFDKIARQAAYLLTNKILFYNILYTRRKGEIPFIEFPVDFVRGGHFHKVLQSYYDEALRIDYEPIFSSNFIDTICFPDIPELLHEIRLLINVLRKYNLSTVSYDVLGGIFQRLIPTQERHNLGQYFTNSDVVDLILKFCLSHEDDVILDPSCGAGTFLVRAYYHKKNMNQRLTHERILDTLWGNDIAKFPAHLATINLAIRDMSVDKNYPNIFHEDFFRLTVGQEGFIIPEKYRVKPDQKPENDVVKIVGPKWFDAIVGNPPYTRQEEIREMASGGSEYKQDIISQSLLDHNGKAIANLGRRAGIHAYFFIHGTKFLKDGGHFGFVVSNSWLDVDYGKGLQEFFLNNYKIVSIIESKVERWFAEADINTCIIILQKCKDEKERANNLVHFVYLKKPFRELFPLANDDWQEQIDRLNAIDMLKKTILAHNDYYENEELKIYPKSQKELWDEGYDIKGKEYVGAKWGKYLRAPKIYFRIAEISRRKLVRLCEIAEIKRGFTAGANEFFYITEAELERRKIEKEFWMHKDSKGKWTPNFIIEKANESRGMIINPEDLSKRVLFIDRDKAGLKGKNILRHIKRGESNKYHTRPTCASRTPGRNWYDLGENINDMIAFPERLRLRHVVFYNPNRVSLNKNLYGVRVKPLSASKLLALSLNNSLTALYLELFARQPGGGGGPLDIDVRIAAETPLPRLELLMKHKSRILKIPIDKREIQSIFFELGGHNPDDVSLDKVQPDRRQLDKIIMGDILGLSDDEQLEVYRAVIDLVKSRIEKARSVEKKNRIKEGIDTDAFVRAVMHNIGEETLGKFYSEKVLCLKELIEKHLPGSLGRVRIDNRLFEWRLYSGKKYVECESELQARYLRVFLGTGLESVMMPKSENHLRTLVPGLEEIRAKMECALRTELESIMSSRTREKLAHLLWAEIIK